MILYRLWRDFFGPHAGLAKGEEIGKYILAVLSLPLRDQRWGGGGWQGFLVRDAVLSALVEDLGTCN